MKNNKNAANKRQSGRNKYSANKYAVTQLSKAIICASVLFIAPSWADDFFVAKNGIDSGANDGSIKKPWASLNYALDQINAGDTINIRTGRYYETITHGSINGSAVNPIVIQSYNGEKVTFDGTVALSSITSSSWTHHQGNIYKLPLTQPIWQLFVDEELMINARWPNARFDDDSIFTRESWAIGLDATTTNGHIETDASVHDLAAANIDASEAVIIANTRHFDSYTRKVTLHSAGSNVLDHEPTDFFWGSKSYYYLQGALSLLDQNKEWHIDAANNMAYFYAADGKTPSGDIRGRNQQFVIDGNNWSYVTFKGLDFFATTIELTSSEAITIEDCNFNYSGASKRALAEVNAKASLLRLTNGSGQGNFVLRNVTITNSDSQAFQIKGDNTVVENSLFENIDWAATEAYSPSASLVFHGNNTLFSRNTIRNAGTSETIATAINGSGTHSSIVAQYNDIANTGFAQSDGAQFQIRIDAQDGTIVHHNWLHDTPKYGFRFDAPIPPPEWGENGFSHHNVVWNSNGANPKGMDDRHYNNLLFDNESIDLIVLDDTAQNGDKSNETTKTINNVSDSISGHRTDKMAVPGIVGTNFNGIDINANGNAVAVKTLLRDPENYDFRPAIGSSLIDAGDVIADVDYSHPTQGGAPDLGAYETADDNYWIPGRKLEGSSHPIPFHDGSTSNINSDLMWREGYKATAHKVYFGTRSGALDYQGEQTNNIFSPDTLTIGKTYYWRVDTVTPTGTITGDEWHFSVEAAPVVTTINPVADAYVDDNAADSNKGSEGVIRLVTPVTPGGAFQQRIGFLKFNVDVPGIIISAKLKLYNDQGSHNKDINVHQVNDTSWAEDTITWNNQPVLGETIVKADVDANSWQEFDLTGSVTNNSLLSLALKRDALDSRREIVSKEGLNKPELVIEYKVPVADLNTAPIFSSATLVKSNAAEDASYSNSIASDANDADGDVITFTKVSGPEWLQVAGNGSISGTPESTDIGENNFMVKVTDSEGEFAQASLKITVAAKDSGTGSDSDNSLDNGTDTGSGSDSGSDNGTGSDDTGVDNGTDESATESSGGSMYYLAGLLFLLSLYRRRV